MPYSIGSGGVSAAVAGRNSTGGKVLERVKSLSYSATVNKKLLDVEADTTEGSVKASDVGEIQIANVPGKGVRLYTKINNALYSVALTKSGQEKKEE